MRAIELLGFKYSKRDRKNQQNHLFSKIFAQSVIIQKSQLLFMSSLRADFRLENVSNSPLGELSKIMCEPVAPLSLTLLDYILYDDSSFIGEHGHDEVVQLLTNDVRRLYGCKSSSTTESLYQYMNNQIRPAPDIYAVDGDLCLSMKVENKQTLHDIYTEINQRYGQVSVECVVDIKDGQSEMDYAQIDIQKLTDRQYEVVEAAYQMGYFSYPRGANATEVASSLDISSSTCIEHINAAQSKIFNDIFTRNEYMTEPVV